MQHRLAPQSGADRRRKLDRTRHCAEPIMRLANRDLEYIGGGSSALAVRELDIEVDLDVSDVVPVRTLGLVT